MKNFRDFDINGIEKCGIADNGRNSRLTYSLKIIGGHPAIAGNWPWQVAILNRFRVNNLSNSLLYK